MDWTSTVTNHQNNSTSILHDSTSTQAGYISGSTFYSFWYVLDGVTLGIAVYVFIVQWIYYFRRYGCQNGRQCATELPEGILLSAVSIFIIIMVVCRIYRTEVTLKYFSFDTFPARMITNIGNGSYGIAVLCTYCVLWLRQRTIYSNPALFHLSNAVLRFISKYFVIYIVVVGVTALSIVLVTNFTGTCNLANDSKCHADLTLTILSIGPITTQLPLLALMLIPLYKHHRSNLVADKRYATLMKRILISTAICLTSDVVSAIVNVQFTIQILTFQMNIVVNLVCVALTPIKWTAKFLSCVRSRSQDVTLEQEHCPDGNHQGFESSDINRTVQEAI